MIPTQSIPAKMQNNSLKKLRIRQNPLKVANLKALFFTANFIYRKYALQYNNTCNFKTILGLSESLSNGFP